MNRSFTSPSFPTTNVAGSAVSRTVALNGSTSQPADTIAPLLFFLDIKSEVQKERIAVVNVTQNRKFGTKAEEKFGVEALDLGRYGDELCAKRCNIAMISCERARVDTAIGAPMPAMEGHGRRPVLAIPLASGPAAVLIWQHEIRHRLTGIRGQFANARTFSRATIRSTTSANSGLSERTLSANSCKRDDRGAPLFGSFRYTPQGFRRDPFRPSPGSISSICSPSNHRTGGCAFNLCRFLTTNNLTWTNSHPLEGTG